MSDAKAQWMRSVGAIEATWATDGGLLSLKLGPAPPVADEDEDHPVKPRTAEAIQRELRENRRRIALGASGGPVRRLGED